MGTYRATGRASLHELTGLNNSAQVHFQRGLDWKQRARFVAGWPSSRRTLRRRYRSSCRSYVPRSYAVERDSGGDQGSTNPLTEFRNSGKIGAYIFLAPTS